MDLEKLQWNLLAQAAQDIKAENLGPYVELRRLLHEPAQAERFKRLFAQYYGLNAARLSAEFQKSFFAALFAYSPGADDPYTGLLLDLSRLGRHKALPFSFVSKLVAIHEENRPLYDRYVSGFFGLYPPAVADINLRIARFVAHLEAIQAQYVEWGKDSRFPTLIAPLYQKCPGLLDCHPHRLCDFLVWQAGHDKADSDLARRLTQ